MSIKLTSEEAEKAGNDLFDATKAIVEKYQPGDMSTQKILTRVGVVAQFGGVTRTTVFGSLVYAASMAPVVGLSKETLIGVLSDLYDATEANPATQQAKETYAESNAKFHAEQAKTGGMSLNDFGDLGGAFPVPGSKLKH